MRHIAEELSLYTLACQAAVHANGALLLVDMRGMVYKRPAETCRLVVVE